MPSSSPRLVEYACENQVQTRDAGAGDPVLLAIDYVRVAALVGARGHRGRIGAGLRFSDADRRLITFEHELRGQRFWGSLP